MKNQQASVSFTAPWGRFLKITSILVMGILFMIPVLILLFEREIANNWPLILAGVGIPPFIAALFMVRGFTVVGQKLHVQRPLWTTSIDLEDLQEVSHDPAAGIGSIRIAANGGMLVFAGLFWSKRLGRYWAYVNDWGNAVVLKVGEKTIVVSPDRPEEFVAELSRMVKTEGVKD